MSSSEAPAEWFREWFGEAYLSLYPHRDDAEAEAGVRLFREAARPMDAARVLDLACGAGRHLPHLETAGFTPVGIDLSEALLREARRSLGPRALLVRSDMRDLPFMDGVFDAVANFFTSFGYFATEAEDRQVASEIRRVLRPGGVFLLDYLNAPFVRATLVSSDERQLRGRLVRQTRWLDSGTVVKKIEIASSGDEPSRTYYERVRLYEPDGLARLLDESGLETRQRYGGYDGVKHDPSTSRLLLVGVAR